MSGPKPTLEPERILCRLEVVNGAGGRRGWSADENAGVVAERLEPGAVVSEVAHPAASRSSRALVRSG